MPKFVNESGKVYNGFISKRNRCQEDEEEEDLNRLINQEEKLESTRKPPSINKRNSIPKPKSNLELYKEELKRLQEQREERNKLKRNSHPSYSEEATNSSTQSQSTPILRSTTIISSSSYNVKPRSISIASLKSILENLNSTKRSIGKAMLYCIDNSHAATQVIECIRESISENGISSDKLISRLFLISDILHNCHASVTNASFYREGFECCLLEIFKSLRNCLIKIDDKLKSEKFKHKVLSVLRAWKEWTLYSDKFVIDLSKSFLETDIANNECQGGKESKLETGDVEALKRDKSSSIVDGEPIDDDVLSSCLEAKGLSLRWYMTLELSEDEGDESIVDETKNNLSENKNDAKKQGSDSSDARKVNVESTKFKASKWEAVDINDDREQQVQLLSSGLSEDNDVVCIKQQQQQQHDESHYQEKSEVEKGISKK